MNADRESRRDGSPFMNMLMIAPLCDSRGKIRYFIGAQVDVSGLVKDCTDLESLQKLVKQSTNDSGSATEREQRNDFQELSEMFNMAELDTVRKHGGKMHREYLDNDNDSARGSLPSMPRLLLQEHGPELAQHSPPSRQSGKLSGIYQNVIIPAPEYYCTTFEMVKHLSICADHSICLSGRSPLSAYYLRRLPFAFRESYSRHSWIRSVGQ